jgi:lactobin A/cerein 7B family class IIb bacteriocin
MTSLATNTSAIMAITNDELDAVNGGIVPIILALAVAATYVEFKFIDGVFKGVARRASN